MPPAEGGGGVGGDAGCPIRGRGKLEGWGGEGGACLSMKSTSFPGSSEDTGNEISRKRHYGKGKNRSVRSFRSDDRLKHG